MEIIPIGGHDYAIGRLNALDQLHVSRKIAPIIPNIMPILTEVAKGDLEKVHGDIRHLENAHLYQDSLLVVHGDIRHLEMPIRLTLHLLVHRN